jgi:Cys-rich repeat protein
MYRIVALVFVFLAAAGCGQKEKVLAPPNPTKNCSDSKECPSGNVCSAGTCVVGVCDPQIVAACRDSSVSKADLQFCCKPWETCDDALFTCKNDPTVKGIGCDPKDPTCTPCETSADCAAGQFCSGAACYDTAGRQTCTSSFQCPTGNRCDKNVFLCVPDEGGCTFCGPTFPELCCESTQTCSQQTGFCVDKGQQQCSGTGPSTDCDPTNHPGEPLCNGNACVQCLADSDCGPGTKCDTGTGACFVPGDHCSSDADCTGDLKCATASQQCVNPQCTQDSDCAIGTDQRRKCETDSFTCVLPPPVCTNETDEPNNSTATASSMDPTQGYSATLCRNDTDFVKFPVDAKTQYVVTVDFGGSGESGIGVQLLNTTFQIESSTIFGSTDGKVQVVGITGDTETGDFYVRIQGNNQDRDEWNYSITVSSGPPPPPADCSPAGQPEEPNDDFAHATPLTAGTTKTFSRCGLDDVDFYQVPLDRLNSIQVTLGGFVNAAGNLNLTLFTDAVATANLPGGNSTNDVEVVSGPEGPPTYYMKVALGTSNGAVQNQTYSITVNEQPRAPVCRGKDGAGNDVTALPFPADPTEDDGLLVNASKLTLVPDAQGNPSFILQDATAPDGSHDASVVGPMRCNPQDIDLFEFTMPANLGGTVQLRFNQSEGDLALDLLDTTGAQVKTSNSSTAANPIEQVDIPGSTVDTDYVIRSRIGTCTIASDPNCVKASGGILGQHYTVQIRTFDDGQCIASEPNGGDDVFANGRCIGNPYNALASSAACTNATAPIAEPLDPDPADQGVAGHDARVVLCTAAAPGAVNGCGLVCGNSDVDFYRVGGLQNGQVLHAVLDYDKTLGALALARDVAGSASDAQTVNDSATPTGHIELNFIAPATTGTSTEKENAIKVKPNGTTGHQVEPYALKIEVGPECADDVFDVGTAANEKPSQSTIIRPNPAFGQAFTFDSSVAHPELTPAYTPPLTHCQTSTSAAADVDVYELFSFEGEHVTVTLTQADNSPTGLTAELGLRPANLDNPAVSLTPPLVATDGNPIAFNNPTTQQLYITVKTPTGVFVTGAYTLVVTAQ